MTIDLNWIWDSEFPNSWIFLFLMHMFAFLIFNDCQLIQVFYESFLSFIGLFFQVLLWTWHWLVSKLVLVRIILFHLIIIRWWTHWVVFILRWLVSIGVNLNRCFIHQILSLIRVGWLSCDLGWDTSISLIILDWSKGNGLNI